MEVPSEHSHRAIIYDIGTSVEIPPTVEWKVVAEVMTVYYM
jgi:hypothetical protein